MTLRGIRPLKHGLAVAGEGVDCPVFGRISLANVPQTIDMKRTDTDGGVERYDLVTTGKVTKMEAIQVIKTMSAGRKTLALVDDDQEDVNDENLELYIYATDD
jgi:hypothetical protein